ncbi:hypothetical protein VTJ04DRAFT_4648 [Mycothermus thermophilus]|uniref:uncharacterized protein n=1 Tax=Humicola insolens TaxID=85995 RepID=UPI0037441E5B
MAEYDRDLRAARTEWKHHKDHVEKWAHGSRYLYGVKTFNGQPMRSEALSKAQLEKSRPAKVRNNGTVKTHNIVKPFGRHMYVTPPSRQRVACHVFAEMHDAADLYDRGFHPNSTRKQPSASDIIARRNSLSASASAASGDPFIYSFDRTTSPNAPLSLEVFIKPASQNRHRVGGDTERLVEREYEVVDENGQAVRGRKVRTLLRKEERGRLGKGKGKEEEGGGEDEGFELI